MAADAADAAEELDSTPVPSCEEESEEEEASVDVVEKEIDGKTYLYDEAGGYAGVPHLLLTPEGDPIGIYDVESGKVIFQDFDEDE